MVAEKLFNDPHLPQTVRVEQHDHRFQIMIVDHGHKLAALEAIKSADAFSVVVGAHSKKEEKYDPPNEQLVEVTMPTLRAQGLPPTVVALRNSIKVSPSERNAARKLGTRIATEEIFERAKRSGKIASGRYGTRNENVGENGERTESTGTDMENAETVYYI